MQNFDADDLTDTGGKPTAGAQNFYFVGVDGGATHCRARLFSVAGKLLGAGRGGPANPVNGLQTAQGSIVTAIENALGEAQLSGDSCCRLIVGAGLAGLALPGMQQALENWEHPFHALYLTTDTHAAALGAHGGGDGAIIVLGTGFSALGLVGERQYPIGGYGFPINATCSGSWFGLEMVKAVLLAADGVGPATSMSGALLETDTPIGLAEKMNNAPAPHFARLAPQVFEHAAAGDAVAEQLIRRGAAFIDQVIQRLLATGSSRIAFVGGVAPHIQPWLAQSLKSHIVQPRGTPEEGAMYFARRSFAPTAACQGRRDAQDQRDVQGQLDVQGKRRANHTA